MYNFNFAIPFKVVPLLESAVRSAYEVAAVLAAPQVASPRTARAEALSFPRVADNST